MTSNPIFLTDRAINDAYFRWLCGLVGREGYGRLLTILHRKDFFWSVPNDDNRAFEGKELRCRFCEECNIYYDYEQFNEAASMLELIIGLAYRCESIMIDQMDNWDVLYWFWKILENAGLEKYTDEQFDEWKVYQILDDIVDRRYNRNGFGGLFPLRKPKKDQRKVELWYQMCAYLVENYYTESAIL